MTATDTREEWLAWRRQGIGASDIGGLLSLSPWSTPWTVWADKVGLLPEVEQTDAMTHGLWAERTIVPWFEHETGLHVGNIQAQQVGDGSWQRATLDGLVYEHGGAGAPVAVLECKATGDSPGKWESEGIPHQYQAQATWQSIVTGIPVVKFAVLHVPWGRISFRIYDYVPDESDKALVLKAARTLWEEHVLTGIPPEVDGTDATTEAIRAAYNHADADDVLFADDEDHALVRSLRVHKADLKALESTVAELENRLKVRMADCAELRSGDQTLVTWKPSTSRRVDLDALRDAEPELVEAHTNTTTTRRFLVKPEPKEK